MTGEGSPSQLLDNQETQGCNDGDKYASNGSAIV